MSCFELSVYFSDNKIEKLDKIKKYVNGHLRMEVFGLLISLYFFKKL